MKFNHRHIEQALKEYLDFFSVVGMTGPRQSGKSTLLQHVLSDYAYVSFDDARTVDFFHDDPERFIRTYQDKVIFDEVQKAPELFNDIKIAVDKDRNKTGKFVLTGSSQFSFVKGISESLAGRIGLLTLLPYQYSEMPKNLRYQSIYRGSYPELVNKKYRLSQDWYDAYINTYLNSDVKTLTHIGDMRDFQRLIRLLAANTSQILNMTQYANDIGVDVKTIKRWISILEASYIIFLLPPYYKNYGKRIVKRPKIYFYDTGIVAYLTGIETRDHYEHGPMAGRIYENYLISEILKRELHCKTHAELFYLRTSSGLEVDLIVDRKKSKELIEIKKTETFRVRMLHAIDVFIEDGDQGYLIYNGKSLPYTDHINVKNYAEYLS